MDVPQSENTQAGDLGAFTGRNEFRLRRPTASLRRRDSGDNPNPKLS
jgi:hypothetical protein